MLCEHRLDDLRNDVGLILKQCACNTVANTLVRFASEHLE
jgi:hypothetical protein